MTLTLDDRRRAMLAEMGIQVLAPRPAPASNVEPPLESASAQGAVVVSAPSAGRAPDGARPEARPLPPGPAVRPFQAPQDDSRAASRHAVAPQGDAVPAAETAGTAHAALLAWDPVRGTLQPWQGTLAHLEWLIAAEWPRDADALDDTSVSAQVQRLVTNMLRALRFLPTARVAVLCLRGPDAVEADLPPVLASGRPAVLLAMGAAPARMLAGAEPLGRLRGRVHRLEGTAAIVTYAPAYLLRNPVDKAKAWTDLCLARQASAPPG